MYIAILAITITQQLHNITGTADKCCNQACAFYAFKMALYALEQCSRILPLMLKLCSLYVKYYICSTNSTFVSFIQLKLQNHMSIRSVSHSSTVQHIINNSSTYVYWHFQFIFAAFATVVNACFDKIITTDSPKPHNPVKTCILHNFVSSAGNFCLLCWHYAQCFCFPIVLKIMLA